MKLRLLFAIAFFYIMNARGQWEQIHPKNSVNRFIHHAHISDNGSHWMAVGNTITLSRDQGKTWTSHAGNFPFVFKPDLRYTDVTFVNDQVGFVVYQSQIFKTTDGGINWISVLSLQPNHDKYLHSAYFNAIAFISEEEGYAVGDFEKIFHTTDGGNHWTKISWSASTRPFIAYTDVTIGAHNEIYIGGYEVSDIVMNFGFDEFVMSSDDKGGHWSRASLPTGFDFRDIEVHTTGDEAYLVHLSRTQSTDQFFFTSDKGENWVERTPSQMRRTRTLKCLSNGIALAWGDDHQYRTVFYRSDDFGHSWAKVDLPVFSQQDDYAITDIVFQNLSDGFAVGAGGNILTTNDGGQSWQLSNAGYPAYYTIDMIDDDTGFASGGTGFFKTVNGGGSWEFMPGSDSLTILDISFESRNNGIFFGWKNFYFHVTQEGSFIKRITLPVNLISMSSALQQGDSLFVCGWAVNPTRNVFMRTGDWGEHWAIVDVPDIKGLVSQFQRIGSDFYMSATDKIRRSNGSGSVWHAVSDFTQDYFESMIVIDDEIIIGFFTGGSVKRSIDGGQTWQSVGNFSSTTTVKDFIKVGHLIFAYGGETHDNASYGAVWRSADNGATWRKEQLPLCDNAINDMDAVGDKVYATGGYGLIFTLDLAREVTAAEKEIGIPIAVYPIPAACELFINLNNNASGDILLQDITGKSIATDIKKMENHHWRIDLANVAAGVYVVSCTTSKGTFRKRIVVSEK